MKQKIIQFLWGLYTAMWSLCGVGMIGISIANLCVLHKEENAWIAVFIFCLSVLLIVAGVVVTTLIGYTVQTGNKK